MIQYTFLDLDDYNQLKMNSLEMNSCSQDLVKNTLIRQFSMSSLLVPIRRRFGIWVRPILCRTDHKSYQKYYYNFSGQVEYWLKLCTIWLFYASEAISWNLHCLKHENQVLILNQNVHTFWSISLDLLIFYWYIWNKSDEVSKTLFN